MGRRFLLPLILVLVSCGGDGAGVGSGYAVRFAVFKGGMNVPCKDVPEITRVDALVENSNGTKALGAEANCDAGIFELDGIGPGDYKIELTAKGNLGGDANATLFTSSTDVSFPADDQLDLSLRPEVAFFELSWSFGEEALMPCADQIARIVVTIGTGNTQGGNFSDEYGCTDTPIQIPAPFELAQHFVKVEAYNHQGFIDYNADAARLFERGDNEYAATLAPIGGVLLLDWTFEVGDEMSEACDATDVGVGEILATVVANDGGATTSERIECTSARPYIYRARRFSPGRQLELVLEGEGDSYFYANLPFRMPMGDFAPGTITMEAVGTATVTVEVQTSTCTSTDLDRFDVAVYDVPTRAGETLVYEGSIDAAETMAALPALPYGTYRVEVIEQGTSAEICSKDELRSIDARENSWDPFVF